MAERDWQKDWEMVQEARDGNWWRAEYAGKMLDALPYWLQRVRELEAENADLFAVAKVARKVVDYFDARKDFMTFAAAISELDVALVKADAWLTGKQIGREG